MFLCLFNNSEIMDRVSHKKILSCTVFNIENSKKCFLSTNHIRMFSEGSRDTEHWKSGLHLLSQE